MKTVSLELAKQLKEAGYSAEDVYFHWVKVDSEYMLLTLREFMSMDLGNSVKEEYAAPTAEEILDLLPVHIKKGHNEYNLALFKQGAGGAQIWSLTYFLWGSSIYAHKYLHQTNAQYFLRENLAEAAGKMWLYLKENNLLKPNIGKTTI